MNARSLCVILLMHLGPVIASSDDFPAPPDATVESIARSTTAMGLDLNIRKFRVDQNTEQVLDFYRKLWKKQASEIDMPPWRMIGRIVDGEYHNVQLQADGKNTWGYLSISDLPDKINNKKFGSSLSKNFPMMNGSQLIDDQLHKDPGKTGRVVFITNNFSAKSNHDYYRNHFINNGWSIVMDEQTKARLQGFAVYTTRGSSSVSMTIEHVGGKSVIVANEVTRGLF